MISVPQCFNTRLKPVEKFKMLLYNFWIMSYYERTGAPCKPVSEPQSGDFSMSDTAVTEQAKDVADTDVKDEAKKPVASKAPKKTKKKAPVAGKILTLNQANAQALKTGKPQDIGTVFVLPLLAVKEYDNPRVEPAALYEQGYILFGDPSVEEATEDKFVSLVHLALDEDIDNVRQYVELIEQHEGPVCKVIHTDPESKKESVIFTGTEFFCKEKKAGHRDVKNCRIERHLSAPQSIVDLAEDIETFEQLNPIQVQKQNNKYVMVEGGRRSAAIMYLHARSRVLRADKAKDAPSQVYPATVKATDLKCSKDDLFVMSGLINLSRKQFTPLQEGRFYHEMCQRLNPETGNKYTMKEAAAKLCVEYGTFRNRAALWRPRVEPVTDEKGVVVKPGKGLTDSDRRKVALGEMTVTAASQRALGERPYSKTGVPVHHRNKGIPLSEMQELFDKTAEENKERRQAIADCMGIDLDQAVKESEDRIQDDERKDLAKTDRRLKNEKKTAA